MKLINAIATANIIGTSFVAASPAKVFSVGIVAEQKTREYKYREMIVQDFERLFARLGRYYY
jgi:hypothetical protein